MSQKISIVSVVVSFVWNHQWLIVPTNSYSNIQPKLLSSNLYFKAIPFLKEKRPLSFPIPKEKLHLKLVRMRCSNHRDEGRGSLWNINLGNFVFQQESFEPSFGLMKRLSGQIGYRNNDLQQYLIPFSQQEKQPLSREGNVSFQPLSIFQPINMVPQYAELSLIHIWRCRRRG